MKKLRYIYALITVVLLSTVIYSCDDSSMFITEEVDTVESSSNGETVKTTFTVGISAPNVSGDLDVATRAGGDNANIEYAKPENGGRFQNLIVVLTDHNGKIYGVECKNWGDGVGVKEYTAIFPGIDVPVADVTNNKQYKVYAFGNVCNDHFDAIKGESTGKVGTNANVNDDWENLKNYCIDASISVSDVYKIDFTPGTGKYKIGDAEVTSVGMPVNNSKTAPVVKGNTQFDVAMKRVCARLQVTFRNFTGTYKDYDDNGREKPNNVYVDSFVIKKALATSTNYFYNGTAPSEEGTADFNFKKALGVTKDNDHIINKIENGKDLVVSMYVFETKKTSGNYTYDLKVDRGKSLGLNTTVIDTANAYVIWNNQKQRSLSYNENENETVICASREQTSKDNIPFSDQVFWKIESAPGAALANTYVLKHCDYESSTDKATPEEKYLNQQGEPTDWGIHYYCSTHNKQFSNIVDVFLHVLANLFGGCNISNQLVPGGFKHTFVNAPATSTTDAQYVNFVLDPSSNVEQSRFTFNLLKGGQKTQDVKYWNKETQRGQTSYNYLFLAVENSTLCCSRGAAFNTAGTLDNFDWTLYAKYIIRKNEAVNFNKGDVTGTITKIDRNHSYELDFSVMPNYETKQELLVNCVRTQNEVSWSEVQK